MSRFANLIPSDVAEAYDLASINCEGIPDIIEIYGIWASNWLDEIVDNEFEEAGIPYTTEDIKEMLEENKICYTDFTMGIKRESQVDWGRLGYGYRII